MGSTQEKENGLNRFFNKEDIEKEKNKILKGFYKDRLEVKTKKPLDFYDMIINIDSFSKKPEIIWKIETKSEVKNENFEFVNDKNNKEENENKNEIKDNQEKEKEEKIEPKETKKILYDDNNTVIGVIGLGNVGKSYLLSLFTGEDLPTGYSIHTKGISIKKKGKLIILDSEGMEAPLTKSNISKDLYKMDDFANKEINESDSLIQTIARDKKAVELFIQDFIIEKSDILFIV